MDMQPCRLEHKYQHDLRLLLFGQVGCHQTLHTPKSGSPPQSFVSRDKRPLFVLLYLRHFFVLQVKPDKPALSLYEKFLVQTR